MFVVIQDAIAEIHDANIGGQTVQGAIAKIRAWVQYCQIKTNLLYVNFRYLIMNKML